MLKSPFKISYRGRKLSNFEISSLTLRRDEQIFIMISTCIKSSPGIPFWHFWMIWNAKMLSSKSAFIWKQKKLTFIWGNYSKSHNSVLFIAPNEEILLFFLLPGAHKSLICRKGAMRAWVWATVFEK